MDQIFCTGTKELMAMPKRKSSPPQDELVQFALKGIDAQIAALEEKRSQLAARIGESLRVRTAAPAIKSPTAGKAGRKRTFSPEHLANLRAAAQRRRARAGRPRARGQSSPGAAKKASK